MAIPKNNTLGYQGIPNHDPEKPTKENSKLSYIDYLGRVGELLPFGFVMSMEGDKMILKHDNFYVNPTPMLISGLEIQMSTELIKFMQTKFHELSGNRIKFDFVSSDHEIIGFVNGRDEVKIIQVYIYNVK